MGTTYQPGNLPKYQDAGCLANVDGLIWVDDTFFGADQNRHFLISMEMGTKISLFRRVMVKLPTLKTWGTRDISNNFPEFGPRELLTDKNGDLLKLGSYATVLVTDYENDGDGDLLLGSEGLDLSEKGEITLIRNERHGPRTCL